MGNIAWNVKKPMRRSIKDDICLSLNPSLETRTEVLKILNTELPWPNIQSEKCIWIHLFFTTRTRTQWALGSYPYGHRWLSRWIGRPINYSRSANNTTHILFCGRQLSGANTLVLCRSRPWKLYEHLCCFSVAESMPDIIEKEDNLSLIWNNVGDRG